MRGLLTVIMLLAVVASLRAAQVQANLTPSTAHVGDTLRLNVSAQGASGQPVKFGIPQHKDLSVLRVDSSGFASGQLSFVVALYDTGYKRIDPFAVIVGKGANAESLFTPVVTVNVVTVLPDSAQAIKPIKPYREHPFQWREILSYWWIPAVLLFAAAVWWAARRFRRAKAHGIGEPAIPLLPADEEALRSLVALKDRKYPARGMLKEFYTEFSQIMRRYLERRYEFPALEMTTFELSREFTEGDYPNILNDRLLLVLREADLVKFAKLMPEFAECDEHINTGFEIVAATRELPQLAAEEKAA